MSCQNESVASHWRAWSATASLTSAGTAAGIDLCLHMVRQDYGAEVANVFARRMVVPPHRDGGQAQFIAHVPPAPDGSSLEPLLR